MPPAHSLQIRSLSISSSLTHPLPSTLQSVSYQCRHRRSGGIQLPTPPTNQLSGGPSTASFRLWTLLTYDMMRTRMHQMASTSPSDGPQGDALSTSIAGTTGEKYVPPHLRGNADTDTWTVKRERSPSPVCCYHYPDGSLAG